jgi:hypothetical protein
LPSADLVSNFCRDPNNSGYIWCFTTNPNKKWAKCDPVKEGNSEGLWGYKGTSYRGSQNRTRSGKECQKWKDQSPNQHSYLPKYFEYAGLTENYCRNPLVGELLETIWCYTTDPATPWEYCNPIHEEHAIDDKLKTSLETITGEIKIGNIEAPSTKLKRVVFVKNGHRKSHTNMYSPQKTILNQA